MEGEDYYTVGEAAKILRVTERTIRRRLERGELQGSQDRISGRWKVEARSVTAAIPDRPPESPQRVLRAAENVQEAEERVRALERQLGRLEGRLELTEQTESTLRETVERERQRADRLEEELREARRSWLDRLWGR